jgi:hypothetical protein
VRVTRETGKTVDVRVNASRAGVARITRGRALPAEVHAPIEDFVDGGMAYRAAAGSAPI